MHLSLTTPGGSLIDTSVDEVIAPAAMGELGILPGHVPLLAALRPGVLVYRTKDRTGIVAVGEGYLEVTPATATGADNRVLVLVDQATRAGEIDRAAAEREVADLDAEIGRWKRELDGEYQALLVRRAWAAARAEAALRATAH